MANAHFGNLGDVWKHLVLGETLAREPPRSYWETHAGSASYPLSHSPARDYGIYYLLGTGQRSSGVTRSTYWEELARFQAEEANGYPGSALLAMRLLRGTANYVLCDTDEESMRTLAAAVSSLGLEERIQLTSQDGLATIRDASHDFKGDPRDALVHIDPFEPSAETQPGLSALSLAGLLSSRGFKLIYWYGYDSPEQLDLAVGHTRDPGTFRVVRRPHSSIESERLCNCRDVGHRPAHRMRGRSGQPLRTRPPQPSLHSETTSFPSTKGPACLTPALPAHSSFFN